MSNVLYTMAGGLMPLIGQTVSTPQRKVSLVRYIGVADKRRGGRLCDILAETAEPGSCSPPWLRRLAQEEGETESNLTY